MAYVTVNEMGSDALSYASVEEIRAALTGASAPRALLVSLDLDDRSKVRYQPVMNQHSVLDIKTELISHLTDYPFTDAWLIELRDYIDSRLAARTDARNHRGISVPDQAGGFAVMQHTVSEVAHG
jgi:hypothetical protein